MVSSPRLRWGATAQCGRAALGAEGGREGEPLGLHRCAPGAAARMLEAMGGLRGEGGVRDAGEGLINLKPPTLVVSRGRRRALPGRVGRKSRFGAAGAGQGKGPPS